VLVKENQHKGYNKVEFKTSNLTSGVYL